jgi:DNA-binding beta-propeller fold protein YncE
MMAAWRGDQVLPHAAPRLDRWETMMRMHGRCSGIGDGRRARLLLVLVLAAWVLGAEAWTGQAQALSQQGHVAAGAFGAEGSGAGQLREPTAVAVNAHTGDIYVVDRGNARIDRFDAAGQFLEAWGWGVADGKKEYERCTTSCKAGLSGKGRFELEAPDAIAVDSSTSPQDPSAGAVYVEARTSEESAAIDKFGPEGAPLQVEHAGGGKHFEVLHGLTVAPDGSLWVYNEEHVYVFDDREPNHLCPEPGKAPRPSCPGFGVVEPELEVEPRNGLAIGETGVLYVGQSSFIGGTQAPTTVGKFLLGQETPSAEPRLQALIDELDQQETTGVAADPATGEVYLDNRGTIAAFNRDGALVQRFGDTGPESLQGGAGVAVEPSSAGVVHPGYVYVADRAANRIDVYAPEAPGTPQVDSLAVEDVTAGTAQLDAQLDPHGASTHYYFEYGTVACASHPGSCTTMPLPPGGEAGAGCPREEQSSCFGDEQVKAKATGLAPGASYHYRLLASNGLGSVASEERTFTTRPLGGRFIADGRGWEMVSPAAMHGGQAEPLSEGGGLIQSSANGQAIAWVSTAPLGEAEGNRNLEPTQLLSVRGGQGWSTQDIVTPNQHGTGIELGTQEYTMFSPNLALALLQPFTSGSTLAEPPLTPPGPGEEPGHQEKTPYLRADSPIAPGVSEQDYYAAALSNGAAMGNPGFLALLTAAEVTPGTHFGKKVQLYAAPDLTHVVVESEVPLLAGSAGSKNLYEWSHGTLRPINLLPSGEPVPGELGFGGTMIRGAISEDGGRVIWSSGGHLYMRDTVHEKTLELDGAGTERGSARFQGASADGSTVFFTDEDPTLVSPSNPAKNRPDLYACEIGETAETCHLTDLTPSSSEHADLLGLALGASESGSSVYFVANGALSEPAAPGNCRAEPQPGAECNLYVVTRSFVAGQAHWGAPRFIARLSNHDNPNWESKVLSSPDLGDVTARVSPHGRYLAFMSEQSLTGYDNRDVNPAANGARDEEVFLYDAQAGSLTCVSCDPSGARPRGVFDPPESHPLNEEGWGLVVDRMKIWQGRWLAGSLPGWTKSQHAIATYQSRYLSDGGRLYFDSPADLVPEATNGKEDVYEYEPLGVPRGANACAGASPTFVASMRGCLGLVSSGTSPRESAFLDASLSGGEAPGSEGSQEGGGDVFFLSAGLTADKKGASFAVYDAHECTVPRPCLQSEAPQAVTSCTTTATCRPQGYAAPASETPATAGPPPSGEVLHSVTSAKPKLTRAQLLAGALKTCRKLKARKKRHRCEASAKARYGSPRKHVAHPAHRAAAKGTPR